ncbi:hypothetical protein Pla175_16840 [Pirellulimonas nuda]|uniref:Uncharacterized protein n=1 Tax=Pirellulimonas nuda TaxID=2528009 RepID=A0A518DA01_9BACT|nr:hypothetical protein [Pirellulimonas nuda]QDU88309.1 hypothetical protein Pla175_16840 [Pirellulimonas nuda]
MRIIVSILALCALTSSASGGEICCDPVLIHTNGMRLASTCPERSSNVYWRCDPYHVGQCGDRYNWPPLNSLLFRTPYSGPCTGADAPSGLHVGTGFYEPIDATRFERIGTLPAPPAAAR